MKLYDLIKEAHGCKEPDTATHFVEAIGDAEVIYDVYLLDWNVRITVPFAVSAVIQMICIDSDPEDIVTEVRTYKVRPIDAIAYALTTFETQPEPVKKHLRERFGPTLLRARKLGHEHWKGMQPQ